MIPVGQGLRWSKLIGKSPGEQERMKLNRLRFYGLFKYSAKLCLCLREGEQKERESRKERGKVRKRPQ